MTFPFPWTLYLQKLSIKKLIIASNINEIIIKGLHYFLQDLEWKVIYVGSAEDAQLDQVLDTVLVGPVPAGRHMFVFQVKKL